MTLYRVVAVCAGFLIALTLTGSVPVTNGSMVTIKTELFYDDDWHDISADVRNASPVSVACEIDERGIARPGVLTLEINNGRSKVNTDVVGRYSDNNPRSDLYGKIGLNTPIRVSAGLDPSNLEVIGVYEVAKWPATWGRAGQSDSWVSIEAYGILRRLAQHDPLASPLRRHYADASPQPQSYWPLEDGAAAIRAESGLDGGVPLTFVGPVKPGSSDVPPGAVSGIRVAHGFGSGSDQPPFSAWLQTTGRVYTAGSGDLVIEFWGQIDSQATWPDNHVSSAFVVLLGAIGGPRVQFQVQDVPDAVLVTVETSTGFDVDQISLTGNRSFFDGRPHHVRIELVEDGSDIDYTLYFDGESMGSLTLTGVDLVDLDGAYIMRSSSWLTDDPAVVRGLPVVFSHFAIFDSVTAPSGYAAGTGYRGETAGRRAERLCIEEGIPFDSTGSLDDTTPMGPQSIGMTLADHLAQCAAVEAAGAVVPIVTEQRTARGVHFRTLASHYNQDAGLTLDYSAGHTWDPQVGPDDLQLANDVTAASPTRAEARATQETGPRNVQDPADDPRGVGRYPKRVDVNVTSDGQLSPIAQWRVHVGTRTDARLLQVQLNLRALAALRAGGDALVSDALGLAFGDRVVIQNPPDWLPPEDIDQILTSYRQTISKAQWALGLAGVPASPYRIAEVEHEFFCFVDGDGSITATGLYLTGDSATYASAPDAAALDITGDIDIRVEVTLSDWAQDAPLVTKQHEPDQISYGLGLTSDGVLLLDWTEDGTFDSYVSAESTEAPTPDETGRLAVRATLDVDDGSGNWVATFYTGPSIDGPWTQLGDPVTDSFTTNIFAGSAPLEIGTYDAGQALLVGIVHAVEIRDGIDGTVVANPDLTAQTSGASSFVDDAGNTWTINGNGQLFGQFVSGTDTELLVVNKPGYPSWTYEDDFDVSVSGVRLTVTAVSGTGSPQVFTVDQTPVNGVEKAIPAESMVTLFHESYIGL